MQPNGTAEPPLAPDQPTNGNRNISSFGVATRITAATARAMHQKRRDKAFALLHPQPTQPIAVDETAIKVASRVQEIESQLDLVTSKLLKAREPRDVQALAMALDRLYGIWSLLTGHPRPGVRRDVKRRGPSSFASPVD